MDREQLGEDSKSNQFQSVDTPHQSAEAPVYLGELRGFQGLIFCWVVYPAEEQLFHIKGFCNEMMCKKHEELRFKWHS